MCGQDAPGSARGWLMADIEISDDAEVSIVVCDEKCRDAFIAHPAADEYIADLIRRVRLLE
jgi:hypothetical protein